MEEQGNLNPRYIRTKVEVKIGAMAKEIIRIGQTVGIEDSSGRIVVDTDSSKVIEKIISEITPEDTVDNIAEERIGIIIIEMIAITEVKIGLEKDHFQEIVVVTELGVQAIADWDQDPELVSIRIGKDAIIIENMIILWGTVPLLEKKEK